MEMLLFVPAGLGILIAVFAVVTAVRIARRNARAAYLQVRDAGRQYGNSWPATGLHSPHHHGSTGSTWHDDSSSSSSSDSGSSWSGDSGGSWSNSDSGSSGSDGGGSWSSDNGGSSSSDSGSSSY
jgi:outer membrane protein TolC